MIRIASHVECIACILSHCIWHLSERSRFKASMMLVFSCTRMTERMLGLGYICSILWFSRFSSIFFGGTT